RHVGFRSSAPSFISSRSFAATRISHSIASVLGCDRRGPRQQRLSSSRSPRCQRIAAEFIFVSERNLSDHSVLQSLETPLRGEEKSQLEWALASAFFFQVRRTCLQQVIQRNEADKSSCIALDAGHARKVFSAMR